MCAMHQNRGWQIDGQFGQQFQIGRTCLRPCRRVDERRCCQVDERDGRLIGILLDHLIHPVIDERNEIFEKLADGEGGWRGLRYLCMYNFDRLTFSSVTGVSVVLRFSVNCFNTKLFWVNVSLRVHSGI